MNILFSSVREEDKKIFVSKLKNKFEKVEFLSDYLPNRKERTFLYKLLKNFRKKIFTNKYIEKLYDKECKKFYRKKLNNFTCNFDYFFIISRIYSKEFINELKLIYPNIKVILFIWDKLEYTSFYNNYSHFDYIFTFDRYDARKYNFIFRPSFYLDIFRENLIEYADRKYDLYYIGQLRGEKRRLVFIKEIYEQFRNRKIFVKIFNDSKDKNLIIDKEIILEKKIDYLENMQKIKNSKVVLDISYKKQKGLTLRCFEALATETKIITDNKDILNYDFYNSNNIFYIEKPEDIRNIPNSFFDKKYSKIPNDILEKYSVDGFIDDIFRHIF